jgi:hypothetical protein
MLKLYKRSRTGIRYWEAWERLPMVVVHEGKVGERGKTRQILLDDDRTTGEFIEALAEKPRAKGYTEIPGDEQHQLVVQYPLKTWGSTKDLQKCHRIEALFNECLGWTGNGRCDGNDIGSGSMNIFSIVVDPELAATTLLEELRKTNLLDDAVLAVRDGNEYRVVHPIGFESEFSL